MMPGHLGQCGPATAAGPLGVAKPLRWLTPAIELPRKAEASPRLTAGWQRGAQE